MIPDRIPTNRTVTILGGDRRPGERMPALSEILKPQPLPELVIEKDIPLPTDRVRGARCAARLMLEKMEPGNSMLIPTRMHTTDAVRLMVRAVRKEFQGRQFTSRAEKTGLRVWRTA